MCDKNGVILERFRKLVDDFTREEIAKAIGCDTSMVTKHYNGDRNITIDYAVKYARHFGVSLDYLVGITEHPVSVDTEEGEIIRMVCEYTKLSENAVNILHFLNADKCINLYGLPKNNYYCYNFGAPLISNIIESLNVSLVTNTTTNYSISLHDFIKLFDKIQSIKEIKNDSDYQSLCKALKLSDMQLKMCKISCVELVEEFQRCLRKYLDYDSEDLLKKQTELLNHILRLKNEYDEGVNNGAN